MNDRGQYGNGHRQRRWGNPTVGISLLHTVGDRDRLVEQIDTEFGQLISELYRKMGGDPALLNMSEMQKDPIGWAKRSKATEQVIKKSPIYPLWRDTVQPVFSEWKKFYSDQSSWEEFKTNWDEYEHWRDRVANLHAHVAREVARVMPDSPLRTPAPSSAQTTIWADVEHKAESAADTAGKAAAGVGEVLKYGLYAALGIGALVAVSLVASSLKSGKNPADKYTELIRQSRKPRAPRALPASGRVALLPGEPFPEGA